MALLTIRHYPDPVLQQVAQPVTEIDEFIKTLAQNMVETMYAAPGVGLAAPQVGISQRLIVLDCAPKDEPSQLIIAVNPVVVSREGEQFEEEGCLSVPGYYCRIHRAQRITVRFLDLQGQTVEMVADDFQAVAFQHEIDHLEGLLFVDHLSSLKKSMFRKKYTKIMEQQEQQL
jgi:peptide deformylase